jgi:hypothetical protein
LTLDFFVSLFKALSTLISFAFGFAFRRGFFAFLSLGSLSELSWSLASVFLLLLDFVRAPGSAFAGRFFGGEGIWTSGSSACC